VTHTVIVGAGTGGLPAACEMRATLERRAGNAEPVDEKIVLKALGIERLETRK
jgi:NADH dehydrogenase FAD-containing subunit